MAQTMKDNNKRKRCTNCQRELEILYDFNESNKYTIFFCKHCDIAMTWPFPVEKEINHLYSSEIYRAGEKRFIKPVESAILLFRKARKRRIEQYRKTGRLLEIGCARGLSLKLMKKVAGRL